jgi:hypothetical protein
MPAGRAALVGLGEGALIGTLFALLFGIFFNGPAFGSLLLYSVVTGGLFGVTVGLIAYAVDSDGRRDFVSETSISADRYEVEADDEVVAEARSALASTPVCRSQRKRDPDEINPSSRARSTASLRLCTSSLE